MLARFRAAIESIREIKQPRAAVVLAGMSGLRLAELTVRELHRLSDRSPEWRQIIAALDEEINKEQRAIANLLLAPNPASCLEALAAISADKSEGNSNPADEDETEEESGSSYTESTRTAPDGVKVLLRLLGQLAESTADARSTKRLAHFIGWVGDRMPNSGKLQSLGQKIKF